MDDIISLIVVILVGLSIFGKLKSKLKKNAKSTESTHWIEKLNTFLIDLQNRIEQPPNGKDRGSTEWGSIIEDHDGVESQFQQDDEDVLIDDNEQRPLIADHDPSDRPQRASADHLEDGESNVAVPHQRSVLRQKEKKRSFTTGNKSPEALRKAIIWSEILGPPVALRDQNGGR